MFNATIYESAFHSSPIGNYLLSPTPEAVILAVNDAFLRTVARKREELVGVSLFEAFPANPDDPQDAGVEALRQSVLRVIATGKPDPMPMQRYPILSTKRSGEKQYEERFWNAVNTPIFDEAGRLICISHQTIDITQQVLAEAAMRKSELRYRGLFEAIDQGFCVVEPLRDENGTARDFRFLEVNPKFEALTGLTRPAGKHVRELVPEHEQYFLDLLAQVAATGEQADFESESAAGRWYEMSAFRVDDPKEHKVAILFKDITGRRRAEKTLRDSEQQALAAARAAETERRRLDAVLEAVPVGIVVSDANGAISLANRAFRHHWGEQYPQPNSVSDFRHYKGWWADGSERHGRLLAPEEWTTPRILKGEDASGDIIDIESFDQPSVRRTMLNSGAPVRDERGRIVGAVVAQLDITERVKAEDALRQADRRKDEFLAMLAHELRNPLAPVAAAAQLLTLRQLDESQVRQTSAIISRQVAHMTGLVDDLLDVSRVTRGLVALDKVMLDAKRILSDAVEQVRPLIESRGHRLTVHTPPDSAYVLGDQKRLVQVMTNLLNNAAKYTPKGGDIVLTLDVNDQVVRMIVADNGVGMTAGMVARAFELFTQAERTSDRSQGGLGIGLSLVKSLVELHDGSVNAYSEGIGRGSRFSVCLPHAEKGGMRTGTSQGEAPDASGSDTLKVMVVDDNADAADMLAMLLEAMGHEVIVEHNSQRALERARREMPRVCLLDIGLPDMDGNMLARRLRQQPETASAILVAVTGYCQEQDRKSAFEAGFDHHFVKPVDMKALDDLLSGLDKTGN